jgi:hypothetical protein
MAIKTELNLGSNKNQEYWKADVYNKFSDGDSKYPHYS